MGMLFYLFIGYPVLLFVFSRVLPAKKVKKQAIRPSVAMIISCYNEEKIIREKLENTLAIDYPKDKFCIYVVSDASSDRTDDIVREYGDRGVRLLRQDQRGGKTLGLNRAVSEIESEIVVFSDANAMYQRDAVVKLVENFADGRVGYVVGNARYSDGSRTSSSQNENVYWNYEGIIKKLESRLHSVVGGDGAIYAIRRRLYDEMRATDINDFVNPLQIVSRGYRGIYEQEAVCTEETSGAFHKEIGRKRRIVNRSFTGLWRVKEVLNPSVTGIFSWMILSHKLLRWLTPIFLGFILIPALVLGGLTRDPFNLISLPTCLFLVLGTMGYLLSEKVKIPFVLSFPYYFIAVNAASFMGIIDSAMGRVAVTWNTVRDGSAETQGVNVRAAGIVLAGLVFWFFVVSGNVSGVEMLSERLVFWMMLALVFYAYIGYPLTLFITVNLFPKPVAQQDITPEVSVLICAYNEDEVIEEKIINSLAIDYPPEKLKIVIASDGSDDRTNEIVQRYVKNHEQLILHAYPDRGGKITVINRTVPKLESEIIVFSDANTMYQADAVRKLVRKFHDPGVGGVSADVILENDSTRFGEGESAYYRYERWIQKNESFTGSIVGADGGMYAIRRELFQAPSNNVILDDLVISMNVVAQGYRLVYDRLAVGYEKNTISSENEFMRRSRVVAGGVQVLRQNEGIPPEPEAHALQLFLS